MTTLKTSFARAAMLLLLAVFTTTTARATDYITDVIVLGHKDDASGAALCATYQNQGYTIISYDLNDGLYTKPGIYLGYKTTSNPTYGSVITDFYIRGASSNISNTTLTSNGHTYRLAQFNGGDDTKFDQSNGDLNYGAGGDYIHLFYTKEHFDDWRLVTGITFNNTQSGAVGQNGGSTGYNLNNGCSGGNAVYMHFTTARGPIFLQDVTSDFTAINGDVLTGTLGSNVKISIENGATVTLRNATINGVDDRSYDWAGITCLGYATIDLASGTTNTVKGFHIGNPGIYVPQDKTLTIRGSGTLNASAYNYGCGIQAAGNVIIESGIISATGGTQAAGIGSCNATHLSGNITITGGTVTAIGGSSSAGIGSASRASCGNITISGGIVTATGSSSGIGSGYQGTCGSITITTGVTSVEATKSNGTNSIGAGPQGTCGTVTIGGVVMGNITQSPFVTYPYTVVFNSNGGTGTMANQIMMYNVAQQLSNNTFMRTNNAFGYWNTQANGSGISYANGQSVSNLTSTQGGSLTLYAQWQGSALADGTTYKATQDGSVTTATYTRTIESERVGKHQSWLVPFDYAIKAADLDKFSFYKINMIANSSNPGENNASDQMWVFLTKLETAGTVLHANMPYVIKAKEAVTNYVFTSSNVTLKAKNTGVIAKTETMEDIYEFYGTYENTQATNSNKFYYVSSLGNISLGTNVTIGPYRWIIRKTSKFGGTASYAPEMRFFDGEEDDDPTGISEYSEYSEYSESWFDLNGRKLSGKPSQKGIYILNGRKVAVK